MTEGSDRGGLGKTMETISTNILIENYKTQNKNESNLNLPNKKKKKKSIKSNISYPNLNNGKRKNLPVRFRRFGWLVHDLTVSFCAYCPMV